MSQILDALRRAEAQRSRGRVPGLHQSAGHATLPPGQPAAQQRRPLLIGGLLLLSLGLIALLMFIISPAKDPGSRARSIGATSNGPNPSAVDSPNARRDPVQAPVERAPAVSPPDLPAVVALPRKAQLPERREAPRENAAAAPVVERPKAVVSPAVVTATPKATTSSPRPPDASAPSVALPGRQDLPPDIQRSLPPITVSGSVYSSDPAQRMLVVNGELWHEGDQIRPGLVLEQIRRRDAILRFNGIRFTVGP